MKNNEVIIEGSDDGEKKWVKLGTFLNEEKAYLSLTWKTAQEKYPYVRVSPHVLTGKANVTRKIYFN